MTSGRNAFSTSGPTSWSADHVPFDSVLGIGHRERTISLLDSPYLVEEWSLPTPVVLLSGDGPCWIGLDYRARCSARRTSVTTPAPLGPLAVDHPLHRHAMLRAELARAPGGDNFASLTTPAPPSATPTSGAGTTRPTAPRSSAATFPRRPTRPRRPHLDLLASSRDHLHGNSWSGADTLANVIQDGTMGKAEGAPTTARLRDVLNRVGRVVIVEGSPDEVDSDAVARIVVTGAEIVDLAWLHWHDGEREHRRAPNYFARHVDGSAVVI
ncbi:hypothetical protein ACFC60_30035 [Kitasatospora purpeofusca]|uniref:hypothetical protein n=1 Tax=Kitasatospora purpeofusca TaxID=67352 RepID=UPI0035DAF184